MIAGGCADQQIFSDTEVLSPTRPPEPRNQCEVVFSTNLTNGLGVPEAAPSWPGDKDLLPVLDACSAEELIRADDHFMFVAGQPMTYLLHRRLFNGPEREGQLVARCESDSLWTDTNACQTLESDEPA